jgi:hypothetical protein
MHISKAKKGTKFTYKPKGSKYGSNYEILSVRKEDFLCKPEIEHWQRFTFTLEQIENECELR